METKIAWSLVGNTLGWSVSILGIVAQVQGDWKQGILFALAAIFFTIKIGSGILDLIKKKYSSMSLSTNRGSVENK